MIRRALLPKIGTICSLRTIFATRRKAIAQAAEKTPRKPCFLCGTATGELRLGGIPLPGPPGDLGDVSADLHTGIF